MRLSRKFIRGDGAQACAAADGFGKNVLAQECKFDARHKEVCTAAAATLAHAVRLGLSLEQRQPHNLILFEPCGKLAA